MANQGGTTGRLKASIGVCCDYVCVSHLVWESAPASGAWLSFRAHPVRLLTCGRVEGGGQPVLSFEQCFIVFSSFPLPLAFVVGGLGFEFCVFVAGWRHALRSEWPLIIIIIIIT